MERRGDEGRCGIGRKDGFREEMGGGCGMREERRMWRDGTKGRREGCGVKIGRGRERGVKRWNEMNVE